MRAAIVLTAMGTTVACAAPVAGTLPAARPMPTATPPSGNAAGAAVVPPGEAKLGDRTLCLVSDEEFVVTASSPKVEHEGKTYYFCCPGCDSDFKKSPEKYLRKIH